MSRPAAFLVLAAAFLLAACGMGVKLAYNNVAAIYENAPPMLTWMVEDYVELSGPQKHWVKERFARTLAWHRSAELPAYRRLLEGVADQAEEPFEPAQVEAVYRELRRYYDRTAEQLLPHAADFLLQLDAAQLAQLEEKFREGNRKIARERPKGTPEEVLQRRAERALVHFEAFTGTLSEAQRRLVMEHLARFPDTTAMRLADRRARQAAILEIVRARPERQRCIEQLRAVVVDAAGRRPEYREALARRQAQAVAMIAALSGTLTREQREHLQRRLRGYAAEIRTLSAAT